PIVVKTKYYGGWVVIFLSGYNNADGKGWFFIVDPKTGLLIDKVSTGAGSPGNDAGLAHGNAFVINSVNGTADAVYAGDLLGNLWRLELNQPDVLPAPVQIAALRDANGNPQPVTSRPMI